MNEVDDDGLGPLVGDGIEPYADVKIFAILSAIVVVIFTFAVIGAMGVYDHVHGWLST